MKNATTIIINGQQVTASVADLRALLGMAEMAPEVAMDSPKKAPKAPKKSTKAPKAPKQAEEPKAEEPKAEESVEFSYTSGGAVIQYAGHNTLKANNLRRVNNAIEKLVKLGFCVSWKRIGGWVWINHSKKADGKTAAEFKNAVESLAKGWEVHGSSIVDKNMLADYDDNFKA